MTDQEPTNGRVTNAQLKLELTVLRAEQRTQHIITRAMVLLLAAPNIAKLTPILTGTLGSTLGWWASWLH